MVFCSEVLGQAVGDDGSFPAQPGQEELSRMPYAEGTPVFCVVMAVLLELGSLVLSHLQVTASPVTVG